MIESEPGSTRLYLNLNQAYSDKYKKWEGGGGEILKNNPEGYLKSRIF